MSKTDTPNALRNKLVDIFDDDSLQSFQQFMASSKDLMSCYRCAIMEIETKFRVLNERFSLTHDRNPIDDIQSRLKSPESIRDKLLRKNLPYTLEAIEKNLYDIAGVRIVCSFIDDIYMLADCLLQQDDITLIKRKDYIRQPKENGYRSLHLIVQVPIFLQDRKKLVNVEVQFRTIAMESWANLEHQLRYKKSLPADIVEKTEKKLSDCANLSNLLDTQMQEIKDVIENA